MEKHQKSKRDFLKTVAYAAPVIATFSVAPAVASIGSYAYKKPKMNKGPANPGNPGNKKQFFAKKNRFFRKKNQETK